ncbi:periplasmic serine protease, Do/DeqQ family [Bacteroidales bacterium 6E]|nr:periplasmic serine protease, Do/DeqQ family [Bacteroidales bacterium 6E]
MKTIRNYTLTFVLVVLGAFLAVFAYTRFFEKPQVITIQDTQAMRYANLPAASEGNLPDLTAAAEIAVHAVVHIKTQSMRGGWSSGNPILDYFGYRQEPQLARGFGSGVILSSDGYIVTNNHVIEGAQKIIVVLNDNREYEARLVGADPSTDLAVLKVEADNMPYLRYGNSDNLRLGEWVLAVGNPFNLTSTVTAGIVSAKARNIGINQEEYSIESFIQTDAAVNPGNSGGALVNQRGELVGINTAIASRTGSYAGYSFAVPISIVRKVVEDLKEFGSVQRALLGVVIQTVNSDVAKQYNLDKIEGVYVTDLSDNGAAKEAGIKPGDVILGVGNKKVNTNAELQEAVSQYRPGDDVKVTVKRNDSEKQFTVTLRNKLGDTGIIKSDQLVLGAELEPLKPNERERLRIDRGLRVAKIGNGKLREAGITEGFIITDVNKRPVYEVNELKRIISSSRGGILIEGLNPNGEPAYFVFGVR